MSQQIVDAPASGALVMRTVVGGNWEVALLALLQPHGQAILDDEQGSRREIRFVAPQQFWVKALRQNCQHHMGFEEGEVVPQTDLRTRTEWMEGLFGPDKDITV